MKLKVSISIEFYVPKNWFIKYDKHCLCGPTDRLPRDFVMQLNRPLFNVTAVPLRTLDVHVPFIPMVLVVPLWWLWPCDCE